MKTLFRIHDWGGGFKPFTRQVGLSHFLGQYFLGQGGNRLDSLSINAILSRIQATPFVTQYVQSAEYPVPGPPDYRQGWMSRQVTAFTPPLVALSDSDAAALLAISINPSDDEIQDLKTVDANFTYGAIEASSNVVTAEFCDYLSRVNCPIPNIKTGTVGNACMDGIHYLTLWGDAGQTLGALAALSGDGILQNPFYCTLSQDPTKDVPWSQMDLAAYFGIDLTAPWSTQKLAVQNALLVVDTISSFPFPPPIDLMPEYFYDSVLADLSVLAHAPGALDPDAVRLWITLQTVANYPAISDRVAAYFKRQAQDKKRRALVQSIVLIIVAIVAVFILPEVVVQVVDLLKTAIETYSDVKERQAAADAMAHTAKLFEKDAPAFSAEVDKAAQFLDQQAADAAKNSPLTPEEQAALGEISGPGFPAVGVAATVGSLAAGVLAVLFLRR